MGLDKITLSVEGDQSIADLILLPQALNTPTKVKIIMLKNQDNVRTSLSYLPKIKLLELPYLIYLICQKYGFVL